MSQEVPTGRQLYEGKDVIGGAIGNLSVGLFASVMGSCGLGLAWREAHATLGIPAEIGEAIISASGILYCILLVAYGLKVISHSHRVHAEFVDPISATFFPTISIGAMLLASGVLPYSIVFARLLWIASTTLTFLLTLVIVRRWIMRGANIRDVTPQWFMPVVGNIVAPIAAPRLGYLELGWFFFSLGLLFWIVLLAVIFFRLVFYDRLPAWLKPTLFILLSPPAVAFTAYIALNGYIDNFARVLFYSATVIAVLLVSLAPSFVSLPFTPTWWSFTFPMDAFASASIHYFGDKSDLAAALYSILMLIIATVIVSIVSVRTVAALISGTLLRPQVLN
jgi:tellurite resistance protein